MKRDAHSIFPAILLLLLLLFPQGFKSFHQHAHPDEAPYEGLVIHHASHFSCLVCKFEFPVNDIPRTQTTPLLGRFFFAEILHQHPVQIYAEIPDKQLVPRAPPHIA